MTWGYWSWDFRNFSAKDIKEDGCVLFSNWIVALGGLLHLWLPRIMPSKMANIFLLSDSIRFSAVSRRTQKMNRKVGIGLRLNLSEGILGACLHAFWVNKTSQLNTGWNFHSGHLLTAFTTSSSPTYRPTGKTFLLNKLCALNIYP